MNSEQQQQRIMGYFIEEAREHLQTIEQGVLNLQQVLDEPESVNELFRAAHSIKGGAAMLGVGSIQHVAHRLEDFFKILKDNRQIAVDEKLKSLLLAGFDPLSELLDELQSGFKVSEELTIETNSRVKPVFAELESYLNQLALALNSQPSSGQSDRVRAIASDNLEFISSQESVFQEEVTTKMRDMLQLFRGDDSQESRSQLQEICNYFQNLGNRFDLRNWTNLATQVKEAIAQPNNSYRNLAPVLIRELKEAQDLVLANRETEIAVSSQIQNLLPYRFSEDDEVSTIFTTAFGDISDETILEDLPIADIATNQDLDIAAIEQVDQASTNVDDIDLFADDVDEEAFDLLGVPQDQMDWMDSEYEITENQHIDGPKVGASELKSLAVLFENDDIDFDAAWEDIESNESYLKKQGSDLISSHNHDEFADLLGSSSDEMGEDNPEEEGSNLARLFGDFPTDESVIQGDQGSQNLFPEDIDFLEDVTSNQTPVSDLSKTITDDLALDSSTDQEFGDFDLGININDEMDDEIDFATPSQIESSEQLTKNSFIQDTEDEIQSISSEDYFAELERQENINPDYSGEVSGMNDPFALTFSEENMGLLEDAVSEDFDTTDTSGLNIFDELGFDSDESAVKSFVAIADSPENASESKESNSISENIDFEFNNLESDNFDVFGQNNISQEPNVVDDLGDFFSISEESEFIPIENKPNTTDELGDFFNSSDEDEITSSNIESLDQELDNNDEVGDFFANVESEQNLSEDVVDNNWSDLNVDNARNSENEFDEFAGFNFSQNGDLDFADMVADSNPSESLANIFDDMNAISSSDNSLDQANLFVDADENDLTILENDFADDLGSSEIYDARSLTESMFQDNELDSANTSLDNLLTSDLIDLSVEEIGTEDRDLTNIQDNVNLNEFVDSDFADNDDITVSTTIDNLADFFQVDDDPDDSELMPSKLLAIDNLEIGESQSVSVFDDLTDLIGSDVSNSSDVDSSPISDFGIELKTDNQLPLDELNNIDDNFEFDDLEAMIGSSSSPSNNFNGSAIEEVTSQLIQNSNQFVNHEGNDFDELEALLSESDSFNNSASNKSVSSANDSEVDAFGSFTEIAKPTDDFDDLENMIQSAFAKDVGPIKTKTPSRQPAATRRKPPDTTMRVDVKYLDSLNNLVGELVVNRNLLEQEQERLQQFITNLLQQVQLLSDVSQRMRDQYDRSLLEASLTAGRERSYNSSFESSYSDGGGSNSNVSSEFEGIEFDRYNTFHVLSQEIIELIVKVRESASDIEFVGSGTDQVTRQLGTITTQVQDDLKQSRMVPFAQIADRLPRGIRDRAYKTGKQADLEVYGREALIDKAILESLTDPLMHLVNNAIDHGLEDPTTRQAAGKPTTGKLTVRAYHQGNQTVISISDDGAGISTEKVKKSAVAKGVRSQQEVDRLNDTEVYSLLFEAGFSTAAEADEFKGRGVGLDVVKTRLDDIRGVIIVESIVGKGTTFTIRLPLTLSISKAMFCISDRARIAFPVDGFEDMVEVPQSQIVLNEKGQPCLPWRDTILPFQHLSNLLSYSRHISRSNIYGKQDNDEMCIFILRNDTNYLALQVDQFLGEFEIVIKQLEGPIPQPAGIAGATVLGDGRVMAIANVLELFDIANGRLRPSISGITIKPTVEEDVAVDPTVLIVDDSITVRELLSLTFAKVGYRVEQAKDGQDAWEKLRAGLPCDMIFCDIEMPRMDGLELLSRLQKDARLKDIPVAMLTSRGADRHRQSAIQLGAKGYFTKPYLEEELLSASKRLLKGETLPI